MVTSLGKDQSYARKVNNKLVVAALREQNLSATNLADKLNLSNAALSSILRSLEDSGFIKKIECVSSNNGKGRKQQYYSLNNEYGLFVTVILTNNRYSVKIANFKEELLFESEKQIEKYDVEIIYEIIILIKNALAEEKLRDIKLQSIIIAVPGRVNSNTKELVLSKHFDKNLFEKDNKISTLFKTHFNVPVFMQNDINLAILYESKLGKLANVDNGLLAFVDNGLGSALIINSKLYVGSNGYAGEIGLLRGEFKGNYNYIDEFVSLRALKNYAYEVINNKVDTAELIQLYKSNEQIKSYINETAVLLGSKLKDLAEVLDISRIVLQGRVTLFGDEYLNLIKQEVGKATNGCDVEISKYNIDAIYIGALNASVDWFIDESEVL